MKLRNETRILDIDVGPGRAARAEVSVRGIDARVQGRGFIYERHDPLTLVVYDRAGERRIDVPRAKGPGLALALAPVALFALTRVVARRRK